MSEDPFARFERSRRGWVIPVVIFLCGAIPTTMAIRAVDRMALIEQLVDEEGDAEFAEEGDAVAAEADQVENQQDGKKDE